MAPTASVPWQLRSYMDAEDFLLNQRSDWILSTGVIQDDKGYPRLLFSVGAKEHSRRYVAVARMLRNNYESRAADGIWLPRQYPDDRDDSRWD